MRVKTSLSLSAKVHDVFDGIMGDFDCWLIAAHG